MTSIVYVDDSADDLLHLLPEAQRHAFTTFNPKGDAGEAVVITPPAESDLWVFDYFYSEDRSANTAVSEENGLSTFQKWRRVRLEDRPPTALVSSDLESAIGPDVPRSLAHILAQRAGVEWVGNKNEETAKFVVALAEASEAVQSAQGPEKGQKLSNEEFCLRLLAAPTGVAWRNSAERQVDRARPPHLVAAAPRPRARLLLGWLLNGVLPYPSFLIRLPHAAARLGITPQSLQHLMAEPTKSELGQSLAATLYNGPLNGSYPVRFWRAGIDDVVWQLSQNNAVYEAGLREAANGIPFEMLNVEDPVVVSDPDLIETDKIASASMCVRAQDEHFPPDVPPAWVSIQDARDHDDLMDKVIFEDRGLVEMDRS
jgi:hypothetical protein